MKNILNWWIVWNNLYSNSGYVHMLWALSIKLCWTLKQKSLTVSWLSGKRWPSWLFDWLSYLLSSSDYDDFMFPRPYNKNNSSRKFSWSNWLISTILRVVSRSARNGWYDLHKRNIDNYVGYAFEAGAIAKSWVWTLKILRSKLLPMI